MLLAAAFFQKLREPASHFLALMDDPLGWGKMLWSCTADVLGKNLLSHTGLRRKGHGRQGVFLSLSGGSQLDPPFRAWVPRKHLGAPEALLRVCSYARDQGQQRSDQSGAGFIVTQAREWGQLPLKSSSFCLGVAQTKDKRRRGISGCCRCNGPAGGFWPRPGASGPDLPWTPSLTS